MIHVLGLVTTLAAVSGSRLDFSHHGRGSVHPVYQGHEAHHGVNRDWLRDDFRHNQGHGLGLARPALMDFLSRPDHAHNSYRSYWDYSVENGPDHWAAKYPECAGLKQSPVALPTLKENHTFIRRLGFYDYEHEHQLYLQNIDNRIDLVIGRPLKSEKARSEGSIFPPKNYFELDRVEFHWGSESTRGSEHTMHGKSFPGEMQFVHFDKKYKSIEEASKVPGGILIAVILLKVVKEDNKNLDPILANLHKINGTAKPVYIGEHDLEWLYPTDVSEVHECEFYMYEGSYTSPPCSEVVMWHVYRDQTGISERQLNHLRSVVSPRGRSLNDNYRPMQPQNDRKIWQFRETIQMNRDGAQGSAFSNFVRLVLQDEIIGKINTQDVRFGRAHDDHERSEHYRNVHHPKDRHYMDHQHNDVLEEVIEHSSPEEGSNIHDGSGFGYVRPYY